MTDNEYRQQVETVVANLAQAADRLAEEGRLVDAGVAMMGLQTIKSLWTRLQAARTIGAENAEPSP